MFFLILILSWCCTVSRLSLFPDPEALFFAFMSGVMQGLLLEKHHLVLVGMECQSRPIREGLLSLVSPFLAHVVHSWLLVYQTFVHRLVEHQVMVDSAKRG